MSIEITMPQMGADMTEGILVRWVKAQGDHVGRGEIIAEIETDKATVELEAFEEGVLLQLVAAEGETVPVGDVIAVLGSPGEATAPVQRKEPTGAPTRRDSSKPVEAAPEERAPVSAGAEAAEADGGRVRISPVARRMASESGIDASSLPGSGPGGRILRRDVEAAIAAGTARAEVRPPRPAAAAAPGANEPLSKMRQAIARRMSQSKQTQPHYYLTLDIDMTAALAFREQFNQAAGEGERVTINDLVVKACALALQRHPKFNAEYSDAGLVYHESLNIAIGIALDEGLVAPALVDCGGKTLGAIARESKDLVERTRSGHLRADEYGSGTFTITNLGAYGVEMLIGIINPPQAAILGVGSVMPQAVVRDGAVVARQVMKVALSADHRVTDGAEGARFIKEVQGLLENPASLAM